MGSPTAESTNLRAVPSLPLPLGALESLESNWHARHFRVCALSCHEHAVQGDWFHAFTSEDFAVFCLGDVSGHYLAANQLRQKMQSHCSQFQGEWQITQKCELLPQIILRSLQKVFEEFCAANPALLMTTLVCVANRKTRSLLFCNAGHPAPLLLRANERIEALLGCNDPLGLNLDQKFTTFEVPLRGNEFLFLYTDGLIEEQNNKGIPFGRRRMRRHLSQRGLLNPSQWNRELLRHWQEFTATQTQVRDDISFVAVDFLFHADRETKML